MTARALFALFLGCLGLWFQFANAGIVHARMGDRILYSATGSRGGSDSRWIESPAVAWTTSVAGVQRNNYLPVVVGNSSANVLVSNAVPKSSIITAAKSISPLFFNPVVGIALAVGFNLLENSLDDLKTQDGQILKRVDPETPNVISDGRSYKASVCSASDCYKPTIQLACLRGAQGNPSWLPVTGDSQYCYYNSIGRQPITWSTSSVCSVGDYVWSDGVCRNVPENQPVWRAATKPEIDDWLDRFLNSENAPLAESFTKLEEMGAVQSLPTPTVTGPSQVKDPAQKTTNPDGSVKTVQNVWNITYEGNKVDARQTIITTVKNSVGDTISTTTEESEDPEDYEPPNLSNPDKPQLYERKYPDGMTGVWDTFKTRFTGSSLVTLATGLMPNISNGGTCPSWPLSLDLAVWDFGTHDVAPPCWLWDVAKAILILSALLLARSLIFGG